MDFVDFLVDIDIINLELILVDLDLINKCYICVVKMVKVKDKEVVEELVVLDKIKLVLEEGLFVCMIEFMLEEEKIVKFFFLLIIKLVFYVVNVLEDEVVDLDNNEYV